MTAVCLRVLCWAIAVVALAPTLSNAQATTDNYTQALRRALLLSNRTNVRLLPFGKSTQDRAIPTLLIADSQPDQSRKLRVMVCAGQHGDEPNPVAGALDLAARLSERQDLLSRCVFVVVPIINPDGFAVGTRTNSNGADLNRDWASRREIETQFIDGLVATWSPHLLFDLHEWPVAPAGAANTIEAAACRSGAQQDSVDTLARSACHATGLSLVTTSHSSNPTLFDRHYTSRGYAAYMIETGPDVAPASKSRFYVGAVLATVEHLCAGRVEAAALSPASKHFSYGNVEAHFAPAVSPAPDVYEPFRAAGLVILVYSLTLLSGKRFLRQTKMGWSHKYVRCQTPEGVPANPDAPGTALIPITARSWARKRLRTRANGFPATLGQITPPSASKTTAAYRSDDHTVRV